MKVLYHTRSPYGMGADRWIYDGYRHAFRDEGHEFYTLTDSDNLAAKAEELRPDVLMMGFLSFVRYIRRRPQQSRVLAWLRARGTKVIMDAGVGEHVAAWLVPWFERYSPHIDAFYTSYAPEIVREFEALVNRRCYIVPYAADTRRFYPVDRDPNFQCDLAYVGNRLPTKRTFFQEVLFPLMRRYQVRVYGPGWSRRDRILRLLGGAAREARLRRVEAFIGRLRTTLSPNDEHRLYASAKICLNFHECYPDGQSRGLSNEREFKIPASEGFQLSDEIPTMWRVFEPDREIVMARDPQDWAAKVTYFLAHEDERKAIAAQGLRRVLAEHTYHHRVRQIVEIVNAL